MASGAHEPTWRSRRQPLVSGGLALCLCLLAGCAADRQRRHPPTAPLPPPAPSMPYQVHCPDVLELNVPGAPDLCGTQRVGPDGRLNLGARGRLRVEGRTAPEVAAQVAEVVGAPPAQVTVRVASYASQQIYLHGEVKGLQHAVAYQGPETVLHLLRRVGVTHGAAFNDVYVTRPRFADGKPPLVYRVNVKDVMTGRDRRSDLVLQPCDEVYVGETRQSCLKKCIPPCLRPVFEGACRLCRQLPGLDRWLGPSERDLPAAAAP